MNMFKHLLPTGRAWNLTAEKPLKAFFRCLDVLRVDAVNYFNLLYLDINPKTTRLLEQWEEQFGLSKGYLTEAQRRERVAAAWRDVGGQSPAYIQEVLRNNGFDVYIHEWFDPADRPAVGQKQHVTPRNPLSIMSAQYAEVLPVVDCGEPLALCGEEFAHAGNYLGLLGYPLVNKFVYDADKYGYTVPIDPAYWYHFFYVCGPNFGDVAQVEATRRAEFEALILKIKPAHLWAGVIVRYI